MSHVTEFQTPMILHRVDQYRSKHGPTPKVEPIGWKPNPPIAQHCHHNASRPEISEIKFTDPISTEQQLCLSDIISHLYENYYSLHEHPQVPTPSSPCVTYDTYNYIETFLSH